MPIVIGAIGLSVLTAASWVAGYWTRSTGEPSTPESVDNQATCVSALVAQGKAPADAANMCYNVQTNTPLLQSLLVPSIIAGAAYFLVPKLIKYIGNKHGSSDQVAVSGYNNIYSTQHNKNNR